MEQNKKTENIQKIILNQNDSSDNSRGIFGKILLIVFVLLIAGSVAAAFYRFMMKRDYIVQAQIDCDPETENCFIWECDPMSLEEGEKCTGNPEEDIWYYKIFSRNAKNIPDCDPDDENCTAYVCAEGESDCSDELCTPENVPEGESCNDPEKYLLENPPEECEEDDEECLMEEECEEGDEECLAQMEEEECAPGDEECAVSEEVEGDSSQDVNGTESSEENGNVPPEGVEPL